MSSSSRHLDDAVSIYAPSTTSSLPSPPHSPTQPQRSVRWKYENAAVHPHAEFTKTKFMNKLFGGHSVSPHTPVNSFRQVPSQDDSTSTIEPSVMLLHHHRSISENVMSSPSMPLELQRSPARWQQHDPPPPSATTKSRRTSPKVPERRKFFMERLFTVARRHVDEASSIAPEEKKKHVHHPVVVLDTVDSATDASVETNERRSNKPWMRPLPVTSSPVTEPQSQHWYHPSLLPPFDEAERVYLPAKLPPLRVAENLAPPPTRWQLFWEDWVHSVTSLHCIASCSAADFRCDDTSDFRSQAELDFLSMHSSYTPDADDDETFRDPYALHAEESLVSGTTFENDTWDERNSSYLSGWGSPATNDDATSFSSQNSAWI